MNKPTPKQLQLASERIRKLTIDQLRDVAGGNKAPMSETCMTSNRPSCVTTQL